MISFNQGPNKFNFRVAGIAIHSNRVLLHTTLQDDFWTFPGGRVEFQESTDQALIREIKEELNIDITVERLICVNEDFFRYDGMDYHEIGFYYMYSFPKGHELLENNKEFRGIEDDGKLIFKWFEIEELPHIEAYPERLKDDIQTLGQWSGVQHYIDRA